MRRLALLALLMLGTPATAVECQTGTYEGNGYTWCVVNAAKEELRTFLYTGDGAPWGQFTAIDNALRPQGRRLAFAMNAGMYHEDRAPVG